LRRGARAAPPRMLSQVRSCCARVGAELLVDCDASQAFRKQSLRMLNDGLRFAQTLYCLVPA